MEVILFSKYRLISELGRGGTSIVYLAEHLMLGTYRAIKRISKEHVAYTRLIKEVHILKSLKHPNIPIIYDIEEDEKYSYIIEEYVMGESLKTFRMRLSYLDERSILNFAFQICDLIQYLHTFQTKILYLDLKPENILVYKGNLKLLDFGASVYANKYKTEEYDMATSAYMAPERLSHRADERSDIYSIGCLLYFLVTGTLFQPSYVSRKWSWILVRNCKFYKILEQCVRCAPSQRFQTIEELRKSLESLEKVCEKDKETKRNSVMSYCIAIAGSERRIGVTHIALAFTSYVTRVSRQAVYVECNQRRFMEELILYEPEMKKKVGYWQLHHIKMLDKESWIEESMKDRYRFVIKDCGVLTDENLEAFLKEEHRILVIGSKPWEHRNTLYWMDKLCDCNHVLYLSNMSLKNEQSKIIETPFCKSCMQVPYIENPFRITNYGDLEEVFEQILYYVSGVRKSGDRIFGRTSKLKELLKIIPLR